MANVLPLFTKEIMCMTSLCFPAHQPPSEKRPSLQAKILHTVGGNSFLVE